MSDGDAEVSIFCFHEKLSYFSPLLLDVYSPPLLPLPFFLFSLLPSISGLPGVDPAVLRAVRGGNERGVQQGAADEVLASGRGRFQGAPCCGLQGQS